MRQSQSVTPERRQFGRRNAHINGWIRIKGRPRVPCVVKNMSPKGALLQCDVPPWMPFSFDLIIETAPTAAFSCQLKHVANSALGVLFVNATDAGRSALKAADSVEEWTGKRR